MSLIKIIVATLLVIIGIFGNTYDSKLRRITFNGVVVFFLALTLGVVEYFQGKSAVQEIYDRDAKISSLGSALDDNRQKLEDAESRADRYHKELIFFALHPLLPKNIEVEVSETKYTNISSFNIVLRSGAGWELWLDTLHTHLCPSSIREGNFLDDLVVDWDLTPFNGDYEDCLFYDQAVGGRVWVSSQGQNNFSRGGTCTNCPAGGSNDINHGEYDILRSSSVYKDDLGSWEGVEPVEHGVAGVPKLAGGFSYFVSESKWRVDPSDIHFEINSEFPFNSLLNKSEEIELFIVPKPGGYDSNLAIMNYLLAAEGAESDCEFVVDPFDDKGPCEEYFEKFPISVFYQSLKLDEFSVRVTYGGRSETYSSWYPQVRYQGSNVHMSGHLKPGSFDDQGG